VRHQHLQISGFRFRRFGGPLELIRVGCSIRSQAPGSRPCASAAQRLKEIELKETVAKEAQRIAAMPPKEFEKALVANHKAGVLNSVKGLVYAARKFWFKEAPKRKHERINAAAAAAKIDAPIGPIALLYADPPTQFPTFTEAGKYRAPENHYETLTDE
jgi:hypothetical protein